jgi:hypothetical protein
MKGPESSLLEVPPAGSFSDGELDGLPVMLSGPIRRRSHTVTPW